MNYRSISDLNNVILQRLHILPRDFDLIVGVPRSGMMPANLLALYLNKPFTDIKPVPGVSFLISKILRKSWSWKTVWLPERLWKK